MRVISGRLKGRKIEGFEIEGTRPTMDRVKESLFAIIQNKINNSICLDLFSGSGNLGIEAVSRGAKRVYLVDHNKQAIKIINNNIEKFDIKENCIVLNSDYKTAIKELNNSKFDIIFLDPPYKTNYIEEAIILIEKYHILTENGIIVCESDNLDKVIYSSNYREIKNKKYGDKYIVILERI